MPAGAATSGAAATEFRVVLSVAKKHHPSVIGKGGANTKRLASEFKVRTTVPTAESDSREITLVGVSEAAVTAAHAELNRMLGWTLSTAPVSTVGVDVPKPKHGGLIGVQAAVLRSIEAKSGGASLTFPDRDSSSSVILIEGSAASVEAAIKEIETISGVKAKRVSGAAPAADEKSAAPAPVVSTNGLSITTVNGVDLVRLHVPKRSQHLLIGTKGSAVKRVQDACDVRIRIPAETETTNTEVTVQGSAAGVRLALNQIAQLLGVGALTSVPPVTVRWLLSRASHGAVIGKGGSTLQGLEQKFGCRISLPPKTDTTSEVVTVEGSATDIAALKLAIEAIVQTKLQVQPQSGTAASGSDVKTVSFPKLNLGTVKHEVLIFPDVENAPGAGHFSRFLAVLQSATKTADIACYTITDDRISRVIEHLHNSGVSVRLLTEASTISDTGADIIPLSKLGVPIRVDCSPYLMHHKFVVLDGVVVITGSFNWTRAAATGNAENVLILPHAELVKPFDVEFGRLWSAATPLTAANATKLAATKKSGGGPK